MQRLVVVESPYKGKIEENTHYARAAICDALARGEAPIASHLLYPQALGVLGDDDPDLRAVGLAAGTAWIAVCDAVVVYCDFGISPGMAYAIERATLLGKPVEYRRMLSDADVAGIKAGNPTPA